MTPLIREWVKAYTSGANPGDPSDGIWFDVCGALHKADVHTLELTVAHARPPFERCYVVCASRQHTFKTLMTVKGSDPFNGIEIIYGVRVNNGFEDISGYFTYAVRDGKLVMLDNDPKNERHVPSIMRLLAAWYGALVQGGEAYQPIIKEGLTSKRLQAKGKAPLFSWHTVKIEPPKPKQEHRGGTHATPRLHDRRGHLRRLKNGKTCWVRACKVGDASKGVVFKDYEVIA